jgi:putative endonuclease
MYYVYILYSVSADKFYIGQTGDVQKRLEEHNHPLVNSKFTAKYLPWELKMYFPVNENRGDAMKVEGFLKDQKSRKFVLKLVENKSNPVYTQKLVNDILSIV